MVSINTVHRRAVSIEERLITEGLACVQGLDDRAQSVLYNAKVITKNKKVMAEQNAEKVPNAKLIAKCIEIISGCESTIKKHLERLGADDAFIEETMICVANNDKDNLEYKLLSLLVKRNPGMYSRKYEVACRFAKQK